MIIVSVVIVNWNTKDLLKGCLDSIPDGAGGLHFEIVVVDNASDDGSAEFVEKNYAKVSLIKNVVNRGFAYACNQGADIARGKYIFLLNPDTILEKDTIRKMVEFLDSTEWVGVVGPQLIGRDGKIQNSVRRFPRLWDMLIRDTILKRILFFGKKGRITRTLSKDLPSSVDQVSGAAMLLRRDIWRDINGMDQRFFMFYEEVDLCKRLVDFGFKILYLPTARIIHLGGGSRRQDRSAVQLYSVRSMFQYFSKYELQRKMWWFRKIYKPLFTMELLLQIGVKEKREFLKKWLKEFMSL